MTNVRTLVPDVSSLPARPKAPTSSGTDRAVASGAARTPIAARPSDPTTEIVEKRTANRTIPAYRYDRSSGWKMTSIAPNTKVHVTQILGEPDNKPSPGMKGWSWAWGATKDAPRGEWVAVKDEDLRAVPGAPKLRWSPLDAGGGSWAPVEQKSTTVRNPGRPHLAT